ncbi:hypothetical protein PoB_004583200 [Plakobranchus ocellatus]|uniref:Uncharacterized protein n=1 Tax=Plakobranchus ocellatus TaxID=259542 RepID=A0AAV4BJ08_9GAST|nr:hypothetical protein PoB_004583200 [Plakobranchus ocellatus]
MRQGESSTNSFSTIVLEPLTLSPATYFISCPRRPVHNNVISGFLGPPSGKDAGGEARNRGREVPADLRADLSAEDNRQRYEHCTSANPSLDHASGQRSFTPKRQSDRTSALC